MKEHTQNSTADLRYPDPTNFERRHATSDPIKYDLVPQQLPTFWSISSSHFTFLGQIKYSAGRLQLAGNADTQVTDVAHTSCSYSSAPACQRGNAGSLPGASPHPFSFWKYAASTRRKPKHAWATTGHTVCTSLLLPKMPDPPTACSPCVCCAFVGLTASENFAEKQNAKQTRNPRTMVKHKNPQETHPPRLLHQYCTHADT